MEAFGQLQTLANALELPPERRAAMALAKLDALAARIERLGSAEATAEAVEAAEAAEAEEAEAAELRRRAEQQPLPTSLAEYRRHPYYVLERDVGRQQMLHPPGTRPLGLCKGQRVFARAALHDLKTEERWHREGWALRPGESPAKRVAKAGGAAAAAAASAVGESRVHHVFQQGGQ